jgi:WhiB family transcriptional regulator, redox-sensing transcriptional regulator
VNRRTRVNGEFGPWIAAGVLDEDGRPGRWQVAGTCLRRDPNLWNDDGTTKAAAICASCPVRAMCLSYAVVTDQREDMWAGHTVSQRDALTMLVVPRTTTMIRLGKSRAYRRPSTLRTDVARMLGQRLDVRQMASRLGKSPSTISATIRELKTEKEAAPSTVAA